jgi:hypothetical protein
MRILLLAQYFPPNTGGEEPNVFNIASTLTGLRQRRNAWLMSGMRKPIASGVGVQRFATADRS